MSYIVSEEEKQLQLVRKHKKGLQGAKLKGMMGHYVKVLSHLIRSKRDSDRIVSQKKAIFRLAM